MAPRPTVEIERRQQILEKALVCFAQRGYHQTTMDDIATQLPFSKGLLYYYFKTKRELFLAIFDDWLDQNTTIWQAMLSPGENATDQLRKGLEYGAQLLTRSSDLARVEFEFYGELGRDPAISRAFQTLFATFRAGLQTMLEAGIHTGEFRPVNTETVAAILLGTYEGLAMQAMVDPEALDWAIVGGELFDLVIRGLAPVEKG